MFGIIRAGALAHGYDDTDFPPLVDPIRLFVESIGRSATDPVATFGRVPLSVPDVNQPRQPPLRLAFELRLPVRRVLDEARIDRREWPAACAAAVAIELARVREAIDPGIAIRIVLETVNGMAKTAPLSARHVREAGAG